jgi:hypothetical protein
MPAAGDLVARIGRWLAESEPAFVRGDPLAHARLRPLAIGERDNRLGQDLALNVQVAAQPMFPVRPVGLRSTTNYGLGHLHVVHCAGNLTAQPVCRLLRNLDEFNATVSRRTVFYAAEKCTRADICSAAICTVYAAILTLG